MADDEAANRIFVARVLSSAGWHVVEVDDGDTAIAAAIATPPNLVVMDISMPRLDGAAATRALRTGPPPLCSVPILAYTTLKYTDAELRGLGMDGRVPKPCTPEVLIATAARWCPDGELDGMHRLDAIFGADEMAELVASFREQLDEAIGELDAGGAEKLAHRIAGVAGTLGFSVVSASWLRVSEGDETAYDQARRDARITMAQIDRDQLGLDKT